MSAPRYAQKPDANQGDIVEALEAVGASVTDLSRVGNVPDLLVGFRSCSYLLEVKTPKGRLSKEQIQWHEDWNGHSCVVRSPLEALIAIGAVKSGF